MILKSIRNILKNIRIASGRHSKCFWKIFEMLLEKVSQCFYKAFAMLQKSTQNNASGKPSHFFCKDFAMLLENIWNAAGKNWQCFWKELTMLMESIHNASGKHSQCLCKTLEMLMESIWNASVNRFELFWKALAMLLGSIRNVCGKHSSCFKKPFQMLPNCIWNAFGKQLECFRSWTSPESPRISSRNLPTPLIFHQFLHFSPTVLNMTRIFFPQWIHPDCTDDEGVRWLNSVIRLVAPTAPSLLVIKSFTTGKDSLTIFALFAWFLSAPFPSLDPSSPLTFL